MYIGVDIGGTKILVACGTKDGEIHASRKIPSPPDSKTALENIAKLVREVSQGKPVSAIAVAAPGQLDRQNGLITHSSNLAWHDTPIVQFLKDNFNAPVILENDAASAGLSEAMLGAAKSETNVLYVTLSTGIGTSMVINGKIYRGAYGLEGGHMIIDPNGPICGCGGQGHFEAIASGRAIKSRYGKIAADITDPNDWDAISRNLAVGLANMVVLLSPDCVVLGGGVSVHYDKFKQPLELHLNELLKIYPAPKIVPAKHIETAVIYGCLILAERAARNQ